jgi:hypothetical protein
VGRKALILHCLKKMLQKSFHKRVSGFSKCSQLIVLATETVTQIRKDDVHGKKTDKKAKRVNSKLQT